MIDLYIKIYENHNTSNILLNPIEVEKKGIFKDYNKEQLLLCLTLLHSYTHGFVTEYETLNYSRDIIIKKYGSLFDNLNVLDYEYNPEALSMLLYKNTVTDSRAFGCWEGGEVGVSKALRFFYKDLNMTYINNKLITRIIMKKQEGLLYSSIYLYRQVKYKNRSIENILNRYGNVAYDINETIHFYNSNLERIQ